MKNQTYTKLKIIITKCKLITATTTQQTNVKETALE